MFARATWISLLAVMSLTAQATNVSLDTLYNQLDQCIDRQFDDSSTPAIFEQIDLAEACPQLSMLLAGDNELISTLVPDPETASLAELADLRYLVTQLHYPAAGHVELEYAGLQAMLDDALQDIPPAQHTSWWKQFIDWLFDRDPDESDEEDLRWLESFLEKLTLSASAARIILYTSILLVVALAVGMIWHEIRLGRTAGGSWSGRRSARNTREELFSDLANTLSVNPAALPRSLPALLNVCIDYLINGQRLPERKSQTNHEFLAYLQLHDDVAALPFSTLCQQAERVLYGDQAPDAETAARCLYEAKRLLAGTTPVGSTA